MAPAKLAWPACPAVIVTLDPAEVEGTGFSTARFFVDVALLIAFQLGAPLVVPEITVSCHTVWLSPDDICCRTVPLTDLLELPSSPPLLLPHHYAQQLPPPHIGLYFSRPDVAHHIGASLSACPRNATCHIRLASLPGFGVWTDDRSAAFLERMVLSFKPAPRLLAVANLWHSVLLSEECKRAMKRTSTADSGCSVLAVYPRTEEDWLEWTRMAGMEALAYFPAAQVAARVEKLMTEASRPFDVLLLVGASTHNASLAAMFEAVARRFGAVVTTKERLAALASTDGVPTTAESDPAAGLERLRHGLLQQFFTSDLAVLEAELCFRADLFLGQAPSTFSILVHERRTYAGKASALANRPPSSVASVDALLAGYSARDREFLSPAVSPPAWSQPAADAAASVGERTSLDPSVCATDYVVRKPCPLLWQLFRGNCFGGVFGLEACWKMLLSGVRFNHSAVFPVRLE